MSSLLADDVVIVEEDPLFKWNKFKQAYFYVFASS